MWTLVDYRIQGSPLWASSVSSFETSGRRRITAYAVWSVNEKLKVAEFMSIGESAVFLFSYGAALKNAVKDAIKSFCRYVKENKTK